MRQTLAGHPSTARRSTRPLVALVGAALLVACSSAAGAAGDSGSGADPSAGASASGGSATPQARTAALTTTEWRTFHGNRARTGVSTSMPAVSGDPTVVAKVALDGAVYASPLVVHGVTVVATENDSVYGLDAAGKVLWHTKIGTPASQSELPCGDIFPLGITGTPTYSSSRDEIYLVAELGHPVRHRLVALHPKTGTVAWHRSVDLPGVTKSAMQQRGALTTNGTHVYIPFGALAGDCGNYKGRLVSVRETGSHPRTSYTPPTKRGGGFWQAAGPVRTPAGNLLITSANGAAFPGDKYDYTNSVTKLAGTKRLSYFAPSSWAQYNRDDVGIGSQNPTLVAGKWVFIGGKSDEADVLDVRHLGGIGGQVSKADLCRSFGGTAVVGSTVYLPCTDGVRAIHIGPKGKIVRDWQAASSITGSPVVGGGRVWALNPSGGTLHALRPSTGASTSSTNVGVTSRFATPAISGNRLLVPTLAGLTIVSTS